MAIFSKKPTTKKDQTETKPVVKVAKKAVKKESVAKVVKTEAKSMKDLYEAGSVKKVVKEDGQKIEVKRSGQAYRILVKPLVTEKVSDLSGLRKYVFAVAMKANKIEVAKAIMETYGVKPSKVNILKVEGKRVRRGRISGQRKNWKKAIVTLPAGQSINVYEGV
ncbi:MAG: 50S ribosomal protein L23 [Candidatus Falkowbacteria bacterium GW2011_GWA2_39_24]|uniref:Large ribosomal subunit protein uL23 n=1 Tax=Candidatus Falkowbacteria bacterium GW2011_GWA2_39_24 TaxID=1618634 RepID=A0A0G0QSC3_9BACT|nr:MAG: 50S ribosomal protein L23 [Candidatus Falkowbacteria bacterium GW2011_GWA2_39_24]